MPVVNNYIARQPIFDGKLQVYAYELLHRSGSDNYCLETDGDRASSEVISNSLFVFGLDKLTRGRKAYINFTAKLLEDEVPSVLPPDRVVVELLESVNPCEKLFAACRKLKQAGYQLALDDFTYREDFCTLLDLADIVKVDFLQTRGRARKEIIERINRPGMIYLAEKVESKEDLAEAVELGYTYYQGFFFSKPEIMAERDIPASKLAYLRVLQALSRPEIDYQQVENLFKSDFSLSYKLLKLINSAAFHFSGEISSIRQALTLLGQRELVKWFSLLVVKNIGENKPDELIVTAICRARFCELLATPAGLKQRSSDLFLLGLFSLAEAVFDQPLEKILKDLPLAPDIKGALLGEEGPMTVLYQLVLSYEQGNFTKTNELASRLGLDDKKVAGYYLKGLDLADQAFA